MQHFGPVDRPRAAEIGVEIAVLRAAEGERNDACGRGRHGIGVEHTERAFDRQHQLDGVRVEAAARSSAPIMPSQRVTSSRVSTLGRKNPASTGDADHGVEVGFGETGVEPIHPHPDPVVRNLGRVGAHAGARIRLLREWDGIFEIEDEGIRWQPDRFLQEFFAIGRDVEKAARKRHGL